ncbi:MAG: hypothetical protein R3E01_01115 [Pirellulaceae bacterium]|nr:hypothetical protein [Planctomycetales bacterium]
MHVATRRNSPLIGSRCCSTGVPVVNDLPRGILIGLDGRRPGLESGSRLSVPPAELWPRMNEQVVGFLDPALKGDDSHEELLSHGRDSIESDL